MKIILIAIATVILFTTSKIAFTNDIDEVLNNYIEAIGGKNVIESINSELSRGTFDVMGSTGEMMIYYNYSERVIGVSVESGDGEDKTVLMRDYVAPENGFSYQMGNKTDYDTETIENRLRKGIDEGYTRLAMNYKGLGFEATMETDETEFGDVHRITFSKNGEKTVELSFDANSFFLINSKDLTIDNSVIYSDYKEVGDSGLLKPYRLQQTMSGFTVDIIITDYQFNVSEPENISIVPEL